MRIAVVSGGKRLRTVLKPAGKAGILRGLIDRASHTSWSQKPHGTDENFALLATRSSYLPF